jgi:hypothetical protein
MAVQNMNVVEQLTQQNASSTSSTGVAQTGILALMMIMMFTMDGRYQSLFGMVGYFLGVLKRALPEIGATLMCAILTVHVCSYELEQAPDSTVQQVRMFWPTFKDPDTLLALHGMLQCIILVSVWYRAQQSWPVPASFLHFTVVSLCVQKYLYSQEAFAVEGPFAGNSMRFFVAFSLVMSCALARKHKTETGERVYPLAMLSVLIVSGYVAWANRLSIASDDVENALFSFVHFVDAAAMLHFAIYSCCQIFGGDFCTSRADGLMLLMILDKVLKTYYILDGFGLLPNSTLESVGALAPSASEFTGTGHPMLLLSASQIACLGFATLGSVAYYLGRFWNEDKVATPLNPSQVQARVAQHRARVAQDSAAPAQQQQAADAVPQGKLSTIIF